jgi:hypothetical protein
MANDSKLMETIQTKRVELTDNHGRIRMALGAEQGVPYIARYDGKGRILSWLTFYVDGKPDIRFFEQNGKGE